MKRNNVGGKKVYQRAMNQYCSNTDVIRLLKGEKMEKGAEEVFEDMMMKMSFSRN